MRRYLRRLTSVVLAYLNLSGSTRYDIEWVDGWARPKVVDQASTYHWETPGGRMVYHPCAYRAAFGRPVYIAATKGTIRVGRGWAIQRAIKVA